MQHLLQGASLRRGTYKIEKILGQGSFGITYLAEHTALGKKVCIKEFFMKELNSRGDDGSITGLSDGSLSYNYAQKFRKEAQNLASMEHPNIVRVTDCFDENATFYYVMEYIEGQDLNTYIKQHALSEAEAVAIIKNVANALIYMHDEKHMLHLDLKPGNIMRRNSDGHIFLIDFGLSKNFDKNGAPETSTTIGLGTAGYAPIEQANQAKNGEFRPTIDVYALGATLYKLLTRETPPPASELVTDDELISDKLKEHNISDAISNVVVNAMLPNVRKRTQTVKSFIDSLTNPTEKIRISHVVPASNIENEEPTIIVNASDNNKLERLRNQAREITIRYSDGYNYYVELGQLPRFVYNLRAENCEKIIRMKNDIILRQQEIDSDVEEEVESERMFSHPFSFDGRIRRLEYALTYISAIFLNFVCGYLGNIGLILLLVLLWIQIAQGAKRCHDLDHSWMVSAHSFLFLVDDIFIEGDSEENEYGPSPK